MTIAAHRFNNDLRRRGGDHVMQRQLTPGYVLEPVRAALGGTIELDPCTEPENPTGASTFYTVDDDGLSKVWWESSIYINPPYGEARGEWVTQAIAAARRGSRVVMLIPAHTDTRIFQKALNTATAVVFIKGRVKFGIVRDNGRQQAASHPSALIGWNVDLIECDPLGHRAVLAPNRTVGPEGAPGIPSRGRVE